MVSYWLLASVAKSAILLGNPGEFELELVSVENIESSSLSFQVVGIPCDLTEPEVPFSVVTPLDASEPVEVTTSAGDFCWVRFDEWSDSTVNVHLSGTVVEASVTATSTLVELGPTGGLEPLEVDAAVEVDVVVTLN